MSKFRIALNIQKPARALGIKNGKDLATRAHLSLNTAYDIWNERSTRIDLTTLATLCDVLKCSVATILIRRRNTTNAEANASQNGQES